MNNLPTIPRDTSDAEVSVLMGTGTRNSLSLRRTMTPKTSQQSPISHPSDPFSVFVTEVMRDERDQYRYWLRRAGLIQMWREEWKARIVAAKERLRVVELMAQATIP